MDIFGTQQLIVRNPEALYLLLLLPLFAVLWLLRRGRISGGVLALRALIAALLVFALADPALVRQSTVGSTLVLLVDQSDSLGPDVRAALRMQAATIARDNQKANVPGQANVRALYFGADAVAADPQQTDADLTGVGADATDLASALRTAGALIGSGGGRIILLSDGAQTRGDALLAARALAQRGIPVDTIAATPPESPEFWLSRVAAPQTLRVGEVYAVEITVNSNHEGQARIALFDGNTPVQAQDITLAPGEQTITFQQTAIQPGIARLRATISGQGDTIAQNNSLATTALVALPPHVLLIEGRDGEAQDLHDALQTAGIESDRIAGQDLPAQLSQLDAYDGAVLVDVPASSLTLDQMTTLREFVRSEGRGLVATGGRASLTLGAYKGTPLEEALPVEMSPPPKPERAEVTLLLIIDRSASMGVPDRPSKLDMAKEAAILATEGLRDNDRLGVLAFDTDIQWAVDFQQLSAGLSKAQVEERISEIGLGGGTDIYAGLDVGLNALAAQPGSVRHAVLLTDGRSFTTAREPYRSLIERMRAQNITLSSIAIGEDADTELLQDLAQWGAGRYHFAGQPQDIPRLTLLESEIALTEPQVEGNFRAEQVAPHPVLRDFSTATLPDLNGYVATTIKPEAELVLKAGDEDPVLAVWQYGLGRSVVWTPSVAAPWAESWPIWKDYALYWAQIVRYTLPEPDSGPLRIQVTPVGNEAIISADSLAPNGAPFDLADTKATIVLPDGTEHTLTMGQTAPGRYEQRVTLPSDGPYAIEVTQSKIRGNETITREAASGFAQPYSTEYLPSSGGATLLAEISRLTGGQTLTDAASVQGAGRTINEPPIEFWLWLLLAALALWPIEIAARRGWLGR